MRYGFVLTQEQGGHGWTAWERTTSFEVVDGSVAGLTARLREWGLARLDRDRVGDGRYFAYLVTLDAQDRYDTYRSLSAEEIIWFYELEHVPVVGSAASSDFV